MKNWLMLALCALILVTTTACRSTSGSREYIPGRGWVPNR